MTEAVGLRPSKTDTPAVPERAATRTGGRLSAIDGLRLLAALMVAMYHFTGYTPGVRHAWGIESRDAFPWLHQISQYGWLGVELFFMISGFVVCMSCWGRTPGAFFRSRIVRLFPAYWAAIVITTIVVTLWPVVRERKPWNEILINFSMLQEGLGAPNVDGVYWTLWNEGLFYLLFAFLVWRGLTLKRTIIFGYGWLIASAFAARSGVPLIETFLQPGYAPFFVAGIALYLIYRFKSDIVLWGMFGLAFIMAQYRTSEMLRFYNKKYSLEMLQPAGALLVGGFFLVLTLVALGYTSRIQWRWLTTAGALTYPFYLLHENIGWTIIYGLRDTGPRLVILVLVTAIMLMAAFLLHRLVEKPVSRILRDRLAEASAMINRPDRFGTPPPAPSSSAPSSSSPAASSPVPSSPVPSSPAPSLPAQRNSGEPDTLVLQVYRSEQ
ncbi:putative acyltransferase [Actinoplanes missouriensis 431]|uniref:Putative acyltransferase n=1 Tax=Actinoplanes missouriensis (strain ATCC 14538 / DSM 43046 / CBS 188.64 / JCM 3121 / NBRC 102363 / NCIMB 12654 / NRRL B-3342 / UNCC 431) TaxID=512565 RepID=I0HEI4_ACTM4|nr:acyltransferase [Actinoplanes missouriensis]BAL91421.1 putative acyltransferase [Actinoplanes missouriensis 431]